MRQAPPEQVIVALGAPQAAPQPPQLATLVFRFTSQPLAALPSQSRKPALQVNPQVPTRQEGAALASGGHTVPHIPQLFVSL